LFTRLPLVESNRAKRAFTNFAVRSAVKRSPTALSLSKLTGHSGDFKYEFGGGAGISAVTPEHAPDGYRLILD